MFSFFSQKESIPLLENEQESVKHFIKHSYHFGKMQESASRYSPETKDENDLGRIVSEIESATSYYGIMQALDHFNIEKQDNLFAYNMGQNKMSVLMGAAGFIWERPNFFYHAIELFRKTEEVYKLYGAVKYDRVLL